VSATSVPATGTFTNNSGASLTGRVTVIVTGHGAEAGGNEYMNAQDTVSLNGTQIGSFSTKVDYASYAQYSPDGNPRIFRNNNTTNPRNWCPGELVPPRSQWDPTGFAPGACAHKGKLFSVKRLVAMKEKLPGEKRANATGTEVQPLAPVRAMSPSPSPSKSPATALAPGTLAQPGKSCVTGPFIHALWT
jgi:hypothetical protein